MLAIVYRLLAPVYRLLAIVYRLLAIVYRLLAFVYRLPLATVFRFPLTALVTTIAYLVVYYFHLPACLLLSTACPRCLQVLPLLLHTRMLLTGSPTHMAYGIALAIADVSRIWDCLHMLARHVNVYALITPAQGSIPSLSQPPLQRKASVLAAHLSTYCSFPVVHAPG